jgi:hypothetical protein
MERAAPENLEQPGNGHFGFRYARGVAEQHRRRQTLQRSCERQGARLAALGVTDVARCRGVVAAARMCLAAEVRAALAQTVDQQRKNR